MTDLEHHWADCLAGCRMLPGSFEKRFVQDMASRPMDSKPLSVKQKNLLGSLVFRYRRQLKLSDHSARKHREKIQMSPVEDRITEQDAFLKAITADPGDDTVRLIYADWLEDRGDPHGEFIRVQCELAKLPPPLPLMPEIFHAKCYRKGRGIQNAFGAPIGWESAGAYIEGECFWEQLQSIMGRAITDAVTGPMGLLVSIDRGQLVRVEQKVGQDTFTFPKCVLELRTPRTRQREMVRVRLHLLPLNPDEQRIEELRKREQELLEEHGHAWVNFPVDMYALATIKGEFLRGFVERVSLPASVWLKHADKLCRVAPIREVEFTSFHRADWHVLNILWWKQNRPLCSTGSEIIGDTLNDIWPGIHFEFDYVAQPP